MLRVNAFNSNQKQGMRFKVNSILLAAQIEECRNWEEIGYNLEHFFSEAAAMALKKDEEWSTLSIEEK